MKGQKGITLVALVITIIVMLILVGVTISLAAKGGLFTTAKDAAKNYNTEVKKEEGYSDGKVGDKTLEEIAEWDSATDGEASPNE